MTVFIEFDDVDEFSASAIGDPGQRVFYLSARSGTERVSVRCEKLQVKAISTWLRNVLKDLPPSEHRPMIDQPEPTVQPDHAFVLGPIGLGYDRANDRLLVQLEELVEGDLAAASETGSGETSPSTDSTDRGHIRFYVTRSQADAFCDHADRLVAAGRPPCSWCGHPLDPTGHACPRMN